MDPPWDKPPESASELVRSRWRVGREAAAKKHRVVESVGGGCHGKSREERRVLFEQELDRHGVPRDPIWVETKLDELEWSTGKRARQKAKNVVLAAGALRVAAGGFADPPAWMELPADVGHPVWAPLCEKTAVDIRPQADVWLERALAEGSHRIGDQTALFDVWFDWQPGSEGHEPIAVFLGSHEVGLLNRQATRRLVSAMEASKTGGAKPYARAHLARAERLQPPYLLVVEIPVPDSDAAD
jgi:hypothetical protein